MKKKYFAPQTQLKTVIIKNRMMAGSPQITNNGASVDDNGDYDDARYTNSIQPSSVWED